MAAPSKVCKWDLKAGDINPTGWNAVAADHSNWSLAIKAPRWVRSWERTNGKRGKSAYGRWQTQHQRSQSWLILAFIATGSATQKLTCTAIASTALKPQTNPWCIFHWLLRCKEANEPCYMNVMIWSSVPGPGLRSFLYSILTKALYIRDRNTGHYS